jgi:hypothetical protein
MADTDVGKHGTLHLDGKDYACKVVGYEAGRDSGDHLLEYAAGGDGHAGDVVREWYVARAHGTNESGTFTLN